jgi:hypothetical protein
MPIKEMTRTSLQHVKPTMSAFSNAVIIVQGTGNRLYIPSHSRQNTPRNDNQKINTSIKQSDNYIPPLMLNAGLRISYLVSFISRSEAIVTFRRVVTITSQCQSWPLFKTAMLIRPPDTSWLPPPVLGKFMLYACPSSRNTTIKSHV